MFRQTGKNLLFLWSVFCSIQKHKGECGELCSLRFTWQRPAKAASSEQDFLYGTFVQLLGLARELADAGLKKLHIEKEPGRNNLFALAAFESGVVAEFELNETLPDSMPDTFFIKANFTHGHLTNQPIVGYFNVEGSIFADESGLRQFTVDSCDPEIAGSMLENIMTLCRLKGTPEMSGWEQLTEAVRKAVEQ